MLIHKMKLDDNMAVLDINSGAVHLVDEIIYDVLDVFNGENDEETIRDFAGRYPDEELREVLAELHELKDEGLLFSPEYPVPDTFSEEPVLSPFVCILLMIVIFAAVIVLLVLAILAANVN